MAGGLRPPRRELIARLLRYNRDLGAPEAVLRNIEALAEGAQAVITGQQPGLFTGPLYTIYKALSAILLAERLTAAGERCVPIFWNHSEDHDLDEVDHIYILRENRPQKLVYRLRLPPAEAPRSADQVELDREEIGGLLEEIAAATPESEFKGEVLDGLQALAVESSHLGEFFSRTMLWLLGEQGLVLIEPRPLRQLMIPFFARMIEEPRATGQLLAEAGERLRREGRRAPLRQPEWFCNFFLDRRRVAYRDHDHDREGVFTVTVAVAEGGDGDGERFTREELLALLREAPERFSTDVATRPLVQDYLFPTRAYVAGPHEREYLAQLEGLYQWFGLRRPEIVPRHRATLVERKIRRVLERHSAWGVALEEYRRPERLAKRLARKTSSLGPLLERARHEAERILAELEEEAVKLDPGLRRPCEAATAKVHKILEQLGDKIAKAQREREPLLQEQVRKVAHHLFPLGEDQERVLNVVEFLIRHGLGLILKLRERFAEAEPGEHLVLDLPLE